MTPAMSKQVIVQANFLGMLAALLLGCQSGRFVKEDEPKPKSSATAKASAIPPPPAVSGPVGSVAGVVRVSGDDPPALSEVMAQIKPGECLGAPAYYGKLFREGPNRALADVLVAVTEYEGSVPSLTDAVTITASGCAYGTRTVALAKWQTLLLKNKGPDAVTPQLVGSRAPALLVALPGGTPVPLPFQGPGEYIMVDRSHPFAQVDVFVLNFPTFAVTGLDGTFVIEGVPAGDAVLSAYLPATGQKVQQPIKVVANQALDVNLTIAFDVKVHGPRPKPLLSDDNPDQKLDEKADPKAQLGGHEKKQLVVEKKP
jgi:hypothetical protein